eukprot:6613353-Prymnesium_polylepis.2
MGCDCVVEPRAELTAPAPSPRRAQPTGVPTELSLLTADIKACTSSTVQTKCFVARLLRTCACLLLAPYVFVLAAYTGAGRPTGALCEGRHFEPHVRACIFTLPV